MPGEVEIMNDAEKDAYERGFQDGMRKAANDFVGPCVNEGEKIEYIIFCFRCNRTTPYVRRKKYEDQNEWLVCARCNEP